jgi:hypothetical protein
MQSLRFKYYGIKNTWPDKFTSWLAWHLPRFLVKWCYVRVAAHATTGRYGNTNPDRLGMMEALKRWDTNNMGNPPITHTDERNTAG